MQSSATVLFKENKNRMVLEVGEGTTPYAFVDATNITILAAQHTISFMMSASQNKDERLRSMRRRLRFSPSASANIILLAFSIMASVAAGKTWNQRHKYAFHARQFRSFDDLIPNDFDDDGNTIFRPWAPPSTTIAPAPIDINYRASPSQALFIPDLPTESPKPSPSPSHVPSRQPTPSVPTLRPTIAPSETQRPSPSPSASPTVTATESPTPLPTQVPTPFPVVPPTPFPIALPPPTSFPTQVPTNLPTPYPITTPPSTSWPTPAPFEVWTPEPTLPIITNPPSTGTVVTQVPSFAPTIRTTVPSTQTSTPTLTTTIPTFEWPSRATPIQFPTSNSSSGPPSLSTTTTPSLTTTGVPIEAIPLSPFGLRLTFAEPLSLDEFNTLSTELEIALADYLFQELKEIDFGQDVALTGFDINVSLPTLIPSAPNANRRLRSLQTSQTIPFLVGGTAAFNARDQSTVNTATLANQVDDFVTQALDSPVSQFELESHLQRADTEVLSRTVVAAAEFQNRNVNRNERPSIAAIAGGFALVGIGALGLIAYTYLWCKGRRKRAAQRKRDREGISAISNKNANPSRRVPYSNNPPVLPIVMPVMTQATRQDDESSDESSYEGVDGESASESSDLFANELRLAASLDRRAWDDYQQQRVSVERGSLTKNARDAGAFPSAGVAGVALGMGLYSTTSQDEDEGMEIVDSESQSHLIIRPTNDKDHFEPYGDSTARELAQSARLSPSRQDPPAPRGSTRLLEPKNIEPVGYRGSLFRANETEQGVEWMSPTSISTVLEQTESTDNSGVESNDEALVLMGALTAGTAMSPKFRNFDGPSRPSPLSFEEDPVMAAAMATRDPENLQASPNSSFGGSIPSSQAVVLFPQTANQSPNKRDPTPQQSENRGIGDDSTEDKQQSKGSSLLTIDIVKEVEKLARFVRRYERKREKQKEKEDETPDENVVAESRSMGYDAFSDSASAMKGMPATEQIVPGNSLSSLKDTYTLTNLDITPVDNEPSETDESSEDSLSVPSEDDSLFFITDGEDEEPLINEKHKGKVVGVTAQFEGVDYGESEDEDDADLSENDSADSRLGITPFNVQQLMAKESSRMGCFPTPMTEVSVSRSEQPKLLHVSRPPVTGDPYSSTILSPIPGTPATPEDSTPRSRFTPSSDLNRKILADLALSTPMADTSDYIFRDESESPPIKRRKSPGSPVDSTPVLKTSNNQVSSPHFGQKSSELRGSEKRQNNDEILWNDDNPLPSIAPLKTLSHLRMRDAILDEAGSEITSNLLGMSEDTASPLASSPPKESRPTIPSTTNGTRDSPFKPSARNRSKGFSSILSMFENKPKEAIFPPNENWQHIGFSK